MTVAKDQKFTANNPCPVCQGFDGERGKGVRCFGFYSIDRKYANCVRDEYGGSLTKNASSNAYSHYMVGECNCGKRHSDFNAPVSASNSNGSVPEPRRENVQRSTTRKPPLGEPVAIYKYDSGSVPFEVHKFLIDGDPTDKTFRQCQVIDGERIWNLKDVVTCLYRQKELESANPAHVVFIVEGEKDVDELTARGLVATCNPMGAGSWKDIYNVSFTGRIVVVVEDHDKPGVDHAAQVAGEVHPVATSVKILRLPNLPDHGDISDYLQAGATREELIELITNTDEYSPVVAGGWGVMGELPSATPPVPTLPAQLLPDALSPWLADEARRKNVPLEYVAMPALSALGSVIGRQCGIKPQKFNDWTVLCNLWGAIVGGSSKMKTASVNDALKPTYRLEAEASEAYAEASAGREAASMMLKMEMDNLTGDIKAAIKGTDSTKATLLEAELQEKIEQRDREEATIKRFVTNDATVEKLGELLRENPNGLLNARDELAGFFMTLEKAGREGDREFWLESWDGTGSFTVDRIGRGTVHIPAVCLTITGSIQPGKLKRYIQEAISGGAGSDGLLQRLQLFVYPDPGSFPEFSEPDRYADTDLKNQAWEVYKRLSDIQMANQEGEKIPFVHFTEDAQMLHSVFRKELEGRLRDLGDTGLTPAFESHLGKYRSLAPALALMFYLADLPAGESVKQVSVDALKKALGMCEFLEVHARKIFATELNPGLDSAFALSKKIRNGSVKDGDSVREIYRKEWAGLTGSKDVFAAVEVLERLGWVRMVREDTGGRPTETLSLHPELFGSKSDG